MLFSKQMRPLIFLHKSNLKFIRFSFFLRNQPGWPVYDAFIFCIFKVILLKCHF